MQSGCIHSAKFEIPFITPYIKPFSCTCPHKFFMAEVRLEHVSKRFDDTAIVVNNVDINIDDKEFVVLVGPSGCGKSTTLKMIAGLEEVSEGNIYIDDTRVNDIPPKDRDIAMVFQNYALYPHMTVFENLAFGLTMRN